MVDLQQLTQEQSWGLLYVVQRWNQENPDDLVDEQAYINRVVTSACNSYWEQLVSVKADVAMQKFAEATPEVQEQVFQLLKVPDIVQDERE